MSTSISKSLPRTAALLLAAIAVFLGAMPSAAAEPPSDSGVVTRSEAVIGLFVQADGYVVTVGPSMEEACTGQITSVVSMTDVMRPNGSQLLMENMQDEMRVYQAEDLFSDVLLPSCAAIFDGDPTTGPVEPIAIGPGRVTVNVVFADDLSPSVARLNARRCRRFGQPSVASVGEKQSDLRPRR